MVIDILIGVGAGFLCGALQAVLAGLMLRRLRYRWLIFIGKLALYIVTFVGTMLYSTAALIACATASLLVLWGTAITRYLRHKHGRHYVGNNSERE